MRVLVISWEYPPIIEGGLARRVRKLSEHLVQEGVEVHVLTRGGGRLAAVEDRHGVTVHRLDEPPFPKDVKAFVRWVEAMNEGQTPREVTVLADGREFRAVVRIDTPGEAEYFRHGGIMQYVLRSLIAGG